MQYVWHEERPLDEILDSIRSTLTYDDYGDDLALDDHAAGLMVEFRKLAGVLDAMLTGEAEAFLDLQEADEVLAFDAARRRQRWLH